MPARTYLIYGASKGLGKAICQLLPRAGDTAFGISRTQNHFEESDGVKRKWIQADLSMPHHSISAIEEVVKDERIDCLIYNTGIWERMGFTPQYDFESISNAEIETVVATNITSCLLAIKMFLPNLRKSNNGKIILIGSTLGLENHNRKEVVFSTTKFALKGIAHSLRSQLRNDSIGITLLQLGDLSSESVDTDSYEQVVEKYGGTLIPIADVMHALRFVIETTKASCVKEIHMPSMKDSNI